MSDKLATIKRIYADVIRDGTLIIDDNGRQFEREVDGVPHYYHRVAFYISVPVTFTPSRDKHYKHKLIMGREIEGMNELEVTQHLAINMTDRLRSAWQDVEASR